MTQRYAVMGLLIIIILIIRRTVMMVDIKHKLQSVFQSDKNIIRYVQHLAPWRCGALENRNKKKSN